MLFLDLAFKKLSMHAVSHFVPKSGVILKIWDGRDFEWLIFYHFAKTNLHQFYYSDILIKFIQLTFWPLFMGSNCPST
jgi:hypothetical protein